jgi:hypothetical protein
VLVVQVVAQVLVAQVVQVAGLVVRVLVVRVVAQVAPVLVVQVVAQVVQAAVVPAQVVVAMANVARRRRSRVHVDVKTSMKCCRSQRWATQPATPQFLKA